MKWGLIEGLMSFNFYWVNMSFAIEKNGSVYLILNQKRGVDILVYWSGKLLQNSKRF
jgi:hypothetical protein